VTILVFYEGVLQTRRDQPILDGFRLVQSLCMGNRVILATSGTKERVDHQLRTERLQDFIAEIIDNTVDLPPVPLWRRQAELARSRHPISIILASDPMIVEWAVEHGVAGLFFAHPGFSSPAYRPDQGNRTWEDLVAEMEARP
jgi:hypothetical protein